MKTSKNLSIIGILVITLLSNKVMSKAPGDITKHYVGEIAAKSISGVTFAGIDAVIDKKIPSAPKKDSQSLIEEIKGDKNQNFKRFMNIIVKTIVDTAVEEYLTEKYSNDKAGYNLISSTVEQKPGRVKNWVRTAKDKLISKSSAKTSTPSDSTSASEHDDKLFQAQRNAANTLDLIKITIPAIATQMAKNKFSNKEDLKSYLTAELKAIFTSKDLFNEKAGMAISFINFENMLGKSNNWKDLITVSNGLETIAKYLTGEFFNALFSGNEKSIKGCSLDKKCESKIMTKIVMEILSPTIKAICKKANGKLNEMANFSKLSISKIAHA